MPSYKVIAKGFHGGKIYDPSGPRNVLHTDKPFPTVDKKEKVPSWLSKITTQESAADAKKRQAAQKKAADAAAKKVAEDNKAIADASFMGDGESSASNVETL